LYPYNDPGQMPVTPVRDKDGEWFRLTVHLPGHKQWLRAWQAQVGRVKLYLLDSNDPADAPAYRGITSELYDGGSELRPAQELVLGIGGWRFLREIGIRPEVCHLNEGHAAPFSAGSIGIVRCVQWHHFQCQTRLPKLTIGRGTADAPIATIFG
jgi:starch phosphorylase